MQSIGLPFLVEGHVASNGLGLNSMKNSGRWALLFCLAVGSNLLPLQHHALAVCMYLGQPDHPICTDTPEVCTCDDGLSGFNNQSEQPANEQNRVINLSELGNAMNGDPNHPTQRVFYEIASESYSGFIDENEILNRSQHLGGGYYVPPVIIPMVVNSTYSSIDVNNSPEFGSRQLGAIQNGTPVDLISLKTENGYSPWAGVCGRNFCGWVGYSSLTYRGWY